MKVLLTTARCNPPLTRTFICSEACYLESQHKLILYNEEGHITAYTYVDDWQKVVVVHDDGHEQILKDA